MLQKLTVISLIALFFVGCGDSNTLVVDGEIQDTPFEIVANSEGLDRAVLGKIVSQSEGILTERFEIGNDRNKYPAGIDNFSSITPELKPLFELAETFFIATDSAYDYRLGEVRRLWRLDRRKTKIPDPEELAASITKAASGQGMIDLGLLPAGWAVDGAVELLIQNGVAKGKVSLGGVSRFWGGMQAQGVPWKIELPPLPGDTLWKVLTPPDGATAVFHPVLHGIEVEEKHFAPILDPVTGQLSTNSIAVVSWADNAAAAAAYAEAFFVMGRREAFNWIHSHQPVGLFLIYSDSRDGSILCETDANLAECVKDSLPERR